MLFFKLYYRKGRLKNIILQKNPFPDIFLQKLYLSNIYSAFFKVFLQIPAFTALTRGFVWCKISIYKFKG